VSVANRRDELVWHRGIDAPPARYQDEIRVGKSGQGFASLDHDAPRGPKRSDLASYHLELIPGDVELRAWQSEDLDADAKLEGAQAIVGNDADKWAYEGQGGGGWAPRVGFDGHVGFSAPEVIQGILA
jgi:hypothetical protein